MEISPVISLIFGFPLVAFWVWIFVVAIKNDFEHRSLWITAILFFNIWASVVFYFAVYKKEIKASKELDFRFKIQDVHKEKIEASKK